MTSTGPRRGGLHVLLAVAPGAGKTFAMLMEGERLAAAGTDVVVASVVTHDRDDVIAKLRHVEVLPPREVSYRGTLFHEVDLDGLLARRPAVALVDEFAHTNVPGSRHDKRWQDVEELLEAGINVITGLNVQHLDSLSEAAEAFTGVAVHETVPDAIVAAADKVDLIDVTPQALRARISQGNVFDPSAAVTALATYFTEENLSALRELAVGWLRDQGRADASIGAMRSLSGQVPLPAGAVVAALTGEAEGEHVLRRASQLTKATGGELIGLHVTQPSGLVDTEPVWLVGQRRLLAEFGGRYVEVASMDVASAVLDFARAQPARHLVLGATRRCRGQELLHGSVINKAIRNAGVLEVHVVAAWHPHKRATLPVGRPPRPRRRVALPPQRRFAAWLLAVVAPLVITIGLSPLRASLGLAGALFCTLLAVVGVAALGGLHPALLATLLGFAAGDFFYTMPLHSLRVDRLIDLVGLVAFGAVAVTVGLLVDILTRQGVQVTSARTEAAGLARLITDGIAASPQRLPDTIGPLRDIFGLDAVAVLTGTGSRWQVTASVGEPVPRCPEDAPYAVAIDDRHTLAMTGSRLSDEDAQLLKVVLDELPLVHERIQLDTIDAARSRIERTLRRWQ